jgi:hypothetical protein
MACSVSPSQLTAGISAASSEVRVALVCAEPWQPVLDTIAGAASASAITGSTGNSRRTRAARWVTESFGCTPRATFCCKSTALTE